MMKRMWLQGLRCALGLAAAGAVLAPTAAQAQITRVSSADHRQAIGFNIGYFAVRGEDSRHAEDVLVTDLDSLAFDIKDFNSATVGGEWLIGFNQFVEGGIGVGFYQKTVPSVYRGFVNTNNSEIEQELKLRVVPITATVRFLPIGHAAVEPYVGAGLGAFSWRYSEVGQFVDFSDNSIFRDRFVAKGTAVGPVILAGLRAPFADVWAIGGEVRYQKAVGDTKPEESRLLDNKIDLGGWTANFTIHLRF
jgi:outer membrane protein W